jgi:hypothetical protein
MRERRGDFLIFAEERLKGLMFLRMKRDRFPGCVSGGGIF